MLTTDSAKLCIGSDVRWILKRWLSQIQNQCFFSFFQKLFSDYIFIFHENMSNWNCSGNFCFFTQKPESFVFQAESTSYYSLKNMPSQKERIVFVPFLSRELWFLGIVLKSWRILHGHILHFDFVSKTASCSTSKETKRQRTSNIRFKPRNKCYCYVVWDHQSL